jgi:lysophospholipase L1-like esterase
VAFNRYGRRDVEWPAGTIADPRSLLVIGDSFVLGNAVEAEDTIPARMEARLSGRGDPREVMNLGMPGGAPPHYALLLEDALREGFAARTIVVGLFVGNDFNSNVFDPLRPPQPPAPTPGIGAPRSELLRLLRARLAQSPRFVGLALTAARWLGITLYDTAGSHVFLREQTPEQRAFFERVLGEIGRMQDAAAAHGRRLYAVVIPNRLQVENGDDLTGRIYDAEAPNRRILAWCEARGLPCLDLLPDLVAAFRSGDGPLYYPIDRHFTPRGYALAADRILDFLAAEGALGPVTPGRPAATDVREAIPARGGPELR